MRKFLVILVSIVCSVFAPPALATDGTVSVAMKCGFANLPDGEAYNGDQAKAILSQRGNRQQLINNTNSFNTSYGMDDSPEEYLERVGNLQLQPGTKLVGDDRSFRNSRYIGENLELYQESSVDNYWFLVDPATGIPVLKADCINPVETSVRFPVGTRLPAAPPLPPTARMVHASSSSATASASASTDLRVPERTAPAPEGWSDVVAMASAYAASQSAEQVAGDGEMTPRQCADQMVALSMVVGQGNIKKYDWKHCVPVPKTPISKQAAEVWRTVAKSAAVAIPTSILASNTDISLGYQGGSGGTTGGNSCRCWCGRPCSHYGRHNGYPVYTGGGQGGGGPVHTGGGQLPGANNNAASGVRGTIVTP